MFETSVFRFIIKVKGKTSGKQSMHLTPGILRQSQAVFYASAFFQLDGFAVPAPAQVTQTVVLFPLSKRYGKNPCMQIDDIQIYPNCSFVERTINVGGLAKSSLRDKLKRHQVLMNESAEQLFASDLFVTSEGSTALLTVEITVMDLGLVHGGIMNDILARAKTLGLAPCPPELGPYLRLQYVDQPEGYIGKPIRHHQAPYGAITVASTALSPDDTFPKGFYVRRIDGALWLRGYRSGQEHIWSPDDHLLFQRVAG